MTSKEATAPHPSDDDPYRIHPRLEKMISDLFDQYEQDPRMFSNADLLKTVQYVSSYLVRRASLRKAEEHESVGTNAGSAVRRYSGAFKTTNITRAKRGARPTSTVVPFDTVDNDDDGPDAA